MEYFSKDFFEEFLKKSTKLEGIHGMFYGGFLEEVSEGFFRGVAVAILDYFQKEPFDQFAR